MYNIGTLDRFAQSIKSRIQSLPPGANNSGGFFISIPSFSFTSFPSPRTSLEYKNNFSCYLDISTLCVDFAKNFIQQRRLARAVSKYVQRRKKDYSQHRRQVKSINRLNYLQFTHFNFGRCSFLTLTISNRYIKDKKALRLALNRIEPYLRRQGISYYVIVKELGSLNGRLHCHIVLFNAPFLPKKKLRKIWRLGGVHIEEAYNGLGGVYYLISYMKKGLNLQWSRGFFKDKILRNDVYYTLHYDKNTGCITPDKVFGVFITKSAYRDFYGGVSSDVKVLEQLRFFNYLKRLRGLRWFDIHYNDINVKEVWYEKR